MRPLVWSAAFVRAFKREVRRRPELRNRIEGALQQLAADPFHPMLHSHKLKGELAGAWACTVDYNNRILFEFVQNPVRKRFSFYP